MSNKHDKNTSMDVTIVGAGIVGVCCALSLQERGYKVHLIDQGAPGDGATYGNAGVISPWSCVPQCMPGVLQKVPFWLLDPNGPVRVRWRDLSQVLPWVLRFLGNARIDRVTQIADAMDLLMQDNVAEYQKYLSGTGREQLLLPSWYVNVMRGNSNLNIDDLVWKLRIDRGAPIELFNSDQLAELEPAISSEYHSAMIIKDQARAYAPGELCKTLFDKVMTQGGTFTNTSVKEISLDGSRQPHLQTIDKKLAVNRLVLSAGIWSAKLLRSINLKLPLIAERGYHLQFQNPGVELRHSILDIQGKFVVSSMDGGIRSAGTSEFADVNAPPNFSRAEILKPLTRRLLPSLNTSDAEQWMGIRPSFPDNLPVIGNVPGIENLFVAFGHSHYGLGMAPATGRLIANAVEMGSMGDEIGEKSPLSISRFL